MNLIKKIIFLTLILLITSCSNNKNYKSVQKKEKIFYSSHGFALIYEDNIFKDGIVNKKLNNDEIVVMHSLIKRNSLIRIINPENSKEIETKISKNSEYPQIFNIVISKKIAEILELSYDNPYVEIIELKKNKTFIAKKSDTHEEEKNVAEKVPVKKIEIDDLSINKTEEKKIKDKTNFTIIIGDFYYQESAHNLKNELEKQIKSDSFSIKKINNNKYRLSTGPFKNFNALKSTYISLNNLGFENLDIYRE